MKDDIKRIVLCNIRLAHVLPIKPSGHLQLSPSKHVPLFKHASLQNAKKKEKKICKSLCNHVKTFFYK